MSKQANVDVTINNEQAKAALKSIQDELVKVKTLRDKAMAEGDVKGYNQLNAEFKKLTSEAGKFEKQSRDVSDVLKNLSSASIRELNAAYQQMNRELKEMKRNDPGYAAKSAQVKALKDEMNSANGTMGKQSITLKGLMSTAMGWAASLGIATSALAIVKGAISSSEVVSDKWERTTMGLSTAWNVFLNTLATGNWSGFIDNLNDAVKAGQNYADMLDLLEDRQRGLSVRHAQAEEEISKLTLSFYDNNKSAKERAAIQQLIIDKTTAMRVEDASYAKQNYETTAQYLADSKKINKQVLEDWLIFSGGTEKKSQMLQSYSDAFAFLKHNKTLLGENNKLVKEAQATIKEGNAAGLFQFKQLTEALSPEEIKKATELYIQISKANAEVNNDVIANKRKLESQLNKEEKAVQKNAKIIQEATKTLSQLIAEKDAEIDAAIQAGNIPLAEKAQIEKKAMEDLLTTYKAVKEAIAQGWDMNQRDQGTIDKLVSIGAKAVKSGSPGSNVLNKRDNNISSGPGSDIQDFEANEADKRAAIQEAEFSSATSINNMVFDIIRNRQQAEFDHKMNLLEKQKERELSNKNLTESQKAAIEEKYAKRQAALKQDQFRKDQNSAMIKAAMNGALGITKTFAEYGFTPAGWAAALGLGIATLAEIAVIKSQEVPEYYAGGYSDSDMSDKKPAGIVHANEFIGSAKAVRNPSVRAVFDVIDYAQRNGTISQINLPAIMATGSIKSRNSNTNTNDPAVSNSEVLQSVSNQALSIINANTEILKKLHEKGVKGNWSLFDLEKIQKDKSDIQSATEM